MRRIFGLYGAGGFGREVMPIARELRQLGQEYDLFFIETKPERSSVNGLPLISEDEFFSLPCDERAFNVAIADSKARATIAERCISRGAKPLTLAAAHALEYESNEVGEGTILCAFSMLTSNARVGRFFHANIYSYVAHDCVVGDFVTFAPAVQCNGNVRIGDHAYVGTGAMLKPGLTIGEGAIVGMGAVVTKDVAPHTTVVGNPAAIKPHR